MSIRYNEEIIAGKYKSQTIYPASENEAGIIQIASSQDVKDGTNNTKAVTPRRLKTNYASKEELSTKQDIISDLEDIRTNAKTGSDLAPQVEVNTQRIEDLTTARIPDVIYHGTPKITGGQISNFSTENYLLFPFEDISRGLPFDIYFSFTTDDDVTTQQNIIDSKFGIALAIQNGKGVMALSSNGTSWDIGSVTGDVTLTSNTTYYVKYSWTGTEYKTYISTNNTFDTTDMVLPSTLSPYKTTIYIGGCDQGSISHTPHPFKGIINFSKSRVDVNGITIWEGMADVGIASRANVSLTNLDEVGEKRFTDLQDAINTKANNSDLTAHTSNGTIHVTASDKIAWSNKQPAGDYATNTALTEGLSTKQDIITDLETIRSGASKGATALQSVPSDYIKNTDYAGADIAGVIKASASYATQIASGYLRVRTDTLEEYKNGNNNRFIGKGTLENIKEDLVTSVGDGKYAKADELNNPYSLFDTKWSDHEISNLSWLRSNGQWNSGSVYVDAYNLLLKIFNGTEIVEGISVKAIGDSTINDYDFVIDTVNIQFKLPIKTKLASGSAVVGNGMTLGLEISTKHYGLAGRYTSGNLAPALIDSAYGTTTGQGAGGNYPDLSNSTAGITKDGTKSGIETDTTGLYLYYYVGETIQNAKLVDVSRLAEQLANKVDLNAGNLSTQGKEFISSLSMPSNRYIDLTLGASGTTYTAPANGYVRFYKAASGAGQYIHLYNVSCNLDNILIAYANGNGLVNFIPVKKDDTFKIDYSAGGASSLRFIYSEGEV